MINAQRDFFRTSAVSALLFLALGTGTCAFADDFRLESIGARGGTSFSTTWNSISEGELFADFNLPWRWDLGKEWSLQTKLNTSVGWIGGGGDNGVEGTAGPALQLFPPNFPLSLEAGSSATGLSRDIYGKENLGTLFQFTTYIGVNFDITRHIRLGYRFQHISNAGMSQHNPGINMNMLALSYVF